MGGKVRFSFKFLLLCCLCMCLLGQPGLVLAQDTDEADEFILEEIMVTGSRIARDSDASASPIVTVNEDLFDTSATVAIETQLNKLPQFTPTVDIPTNGGDIQPNAQNTPGEATVAMRGIGSNRTLVLINGRRGTPSNAFGVLDLNTIPLPAIEYIQAISGGASSTYGADAMAGVLNFIMKDSFEGLQLDAQMGITQEGDNFEYQVGGVMGADFADDRGNIMLAFSYNERNKALRKDRDYFRDLWADPEDNMSGFFPQFAGFYTGFANLPDVGTLNTVIDGASFFMPPLGATIYDDGNGQAFTGFVGIPGLGVEAGTSGADIADNYNFTLTNTDVYTYNFTDAYLIFPMDRYNVYTSGNYNINEHIGAFAQGYFSKVSTLTVQEPAPIVYGWSVFIDDPSIHQAAIPEEIWTILQSRPEPNAPFQLNAGMPENRGTETDVFTYNMIAGLEGDIPGIDWTWEFFVSRGEAETTAINMGVYSLQRISAVMNGAPNFGQGFSQTGNAGPNANFGAATGTCTSGLNPFDWGSVSQDCWDAIRGDLKTKQLMEQTIWEANAQGAVADLPAGEMRGALGVSTRENNYLFQNDTLTTQGTSFMEQALGIYPTGDSEGTISVDEGYAELLVPVLSDLPGFQQLNLELGVRNSSYNTTGSSWTYKALFDWRGNDWLRLRGGYNRAERAPNIAELYMAPLQEFAGAAGGDVCSMDNGQAFSADEQANPENWQNVVALCGQLMEAVSPTADDTYYGSDYRDIIAGTPPVGQLPPGLSFVFPFTIGNPNLDPEKADTWTLGLVIDSPFEHPALSDLRISLDYYQIEINDAIGRQTADIVMRQCVDPAFNPTYDPNSPYCAGFKHNANGGIGALERTYFNNGRFETSGIDLSIDWGMDAGPGRVGVNALLNYLIDKKSAELDVLPLVDYAGTLGPTENGLNGNSYDWRSLTTMSYSILDLGLSLRWQHLSSIEMGIYAILPDTPMKGAPAYDLFDLLGTYQLLDNLSLRFGIENVFNKEPPLLNQNTAATGGIGGTLRAGSYWDPTYGQGYDLNGRRFYLGGTVTF